MKHELQGGRQFSSCQNRSTSCGACCGLYNLRLTKDEVHRLLEERTRRFASIGPDFEASEMVRYRTEREEVESGIARHDEETYVCPFLGFLDANARSADSTEITPLANANRPGCLAHPLQTGLSHTQNFSFYGASICQAYDCRTKEEDTDKHWSSLCEWVAPDYHAYGRLVADYKFYSVFLCAGGLVEGLAREIHLVSFRLRAFVFLAVARLLCADSKCVTSFEIGPASGSDPAESLLLLLRDAIGQSLVLDEFLCNKDPSARNLFVQEQGGEQPLRVTEERIRECSNRLFG